jgi:hypothetical protein
MTRSNSISSPSCGAWGRGSCRPSRCGGPDAVQQHVHLADGPRAQVLLLPIEATGSSGCRRGGDVVRALDQHAARAAGRVADAHPSAGASSSTMSSHDLAWACRTRRPSCRRRRRTSRSGTRTRAPACRARRASRCAGPPWRSAAPAGAGWRRAASRRPASARRCSRCREHALERAFSSSSAAQALLSTSPRLVAAFWISDQRAALGTKNWCSSGSSGSMPSAISAAHSSLEPVGQALEEQQPEDEALVVRAVDGPAQDVGRGDHRYASSSGP